ncbi:MAG TPA: arabinofuranosyltransferase, partial [Cytophagaceae bacterium]
VLNYACTSYGIGGDLYDQGFLTSLLNKFTYYGFFSDGFYKDLPNFYPPLYYYLLSVCANLLNDQPYKYLKYGMALAAFSIPFITFKLWRNIVNSNTALILSFSILVYQDWHKTAAWIALVLAIPFWLYFVERVLSPKKFSLLNYFVGGFLGAILFQFQYYWFMLLIIASIITSISNLILIKDKSKFLYEAKHKLIMYSLAGLLSLHYIIPYALSMVRNGSEPMQNRWYDDGMGNFPFPFFDLNFISILWLLGLVYNISIWKLNKLAINLCILLLSAYLWYGLGMIMVLLKVPILHFKMIYPIRYILTLITLHSFAHVMYKRSFSNKYKQQICVIGLIAVGFFGFSFQRMDTQGALNSTYPSREILILEELTLGKYKDKVFLTSKNIEKLNSYLPIFSFYNWIHYAHPAALHQSRTNYLDKLAKLKDKEIFAYALMNNRYNKVDYLYFDSNINEIQLAKDYFPFLDVYNISLRAELFDPQNFDNRNKDNYYLYEVKHRTNLFLHFKKLDAYIDHDLITLFGLKSLFGKDLSQNFDLISSTALEKEILGRVQSKKLNLGELERLDNITSTIDYKLEHDDKIEKLVNPHIWKSIGAFTVDTLSLRYVGPIEHDNSSKNKQVLKMDPTSTGHVVFGPYLSLSPGAYKVKFELKTSNNLMRDEILVLDVYQNPGLIYDTRRIHSNQFKQINKYQAFDLIFKTPIDINQVEFRILYKGKDTVWFDKIELFKMIE